MNPIKAANPITVTKRAAGLAGAAVGLVGTVAREAVHAPVDMTRGAIGLVDAAVGLAGTLARETAHLLWTDQRDEHTAHPRGAADSTAVTDDPNIAGPTTAAAAASAVREVAGAPTGPTVVPVEPHAPEEPPVDVVGEALAAEAAERGEGPDGVGIAHEPRGASRDEEHGDAALQRAEVEEIADEAAAALEGDVEPEEHLTEPLIASADAKAMAAEQATMGKAANTDKG